MTKATKASIYMMLMVRKRDHGGGEPRRSWLDNRYGDQALAAGLVEEVPGTEDPGPARQGNIVVLTPAGEAFLAAAGEAQKGPASRGQRSLSCSSCRREDIAVRDLAAMTIVYSDPLVRMSG